MFQKNHQTWNRESFEEWYEYGKQSDFYQLFSPLFKEKVKNSENTNILETGNSLLAQWGVDSWLTFYAAYPMTPATSIIDEILKHPEVTFFQGEDEIAVAMSMLGATYAGKKAMCGTSGWGFALMTESLSFSIQSEIGWVFILVQRDGPSTGTPTYTAQGDLLMALYSTFGANSPIVIAPSNFEEYYTMIGKALGFSQRYQHPVVILWEKCLSEGYITFNTEKKNQNNGIDTWILSEEAENDQYQRYQNTENGISPYSFPGRKNTIFMATSYEHDESGATNEDPLIKEEQTQKRRRKMLTFQKEQLETQKLDSFEVINPHAHKFLITWGSNAMTLKYVLKDYSDWGLLVIKVFYPFNDQIKQFLESSKENIEKLCFVEMNSEGQAEKWLSEYCGLKDKSRENKIMHYRKTTLYPIFKEEIEEYLNHGSE